MTMPLYNYTPHIKWRTSNYLQNTKLLTIYTRILYHVTCYDTINHCEYCLRFLKANFLYKISKTYLIIFKLNEIVGVFLLFVLALSTLWSINTFINICCCFLFVLVIVWFWYNSCSTKLIVSLIQTS